MNSEAVSLRTQRLAAGAVRITSGWEGWWALSVSVLWKSQAGDSVN